MQLTRRAGARVVISSRHLDFSEKSDRRQLNEKREDRDLQATSKLSTLSSVSTIVPSKRLSMCSWSVREDTESREPDEKSERLERSDGRTSSFARTTRSKLVKPLRIPYLTHISRLCLLCCFYVLSMATDVVPSFSLLSSESSTFLPSLVWFTR